MSISQQCLKFLLVSLILASAPKVSAQSIVPNNDGLNTSVNQIRNQYNITGGTQAGANLFFSLQKLGLTTGEIANFISNPNVLNVLTRVTGGEASLINGLLQVTGGNSNLFILNPAGIVFGANASLNVPANFSASTATGIQVGNGWFGINSSVDEVRQLNGNITGYGFTNSLPSLDSNNSGNVGIISNQGNLGTNIGQSVTLVGGKVVNTGTIATPSGNITIAATPDNKFIKITNEGNVLSFELPISDRQALGNAPVLRGVDLPSLLTGKNAGSTVVSGNLDVSGDKGGNVQVLGNDVSLASANINASGLNGGGKVLIGGDLQGVGTTPKSLFTSVDSNSTIRADALVSGNGGQVVVWSDGSTAFDGKISAKAGTQSGNGGLVETSGKTNLSVGNNAKVDTSALNGKTGTWLLDPTDLTVVGTGGTGTIAAGNNSVADSTINNSTIVTALNSTNVNLTATNSITVNVAIDASANTNARNLTLTAPTANLNQPINLRTGGVLSGTATTVNVGASGTVQNGVDVAATNGTVNLAAANYSLGSTVNINKDLTVNGAGAANTTVNGNNAVQVFNIGSNRTVNINDLTVANGRIVSDNNGGGGAIINTGATLNVNNIIFSGNSAERANFGGRAFGGAIYVLDSTSTLNVRNSTFSGNFTNTPAASGGAIYNRGITTLENSNFRNNVSTTGGAITSEGGSLGIVGSNFDDNVAGFGGAIYGFSNTLIRINNSNFSNNFTTPTGNVSIGGEGGAIYIGIFSDTANTLEVNNSNFLNNISPQGTGGAIFKRRGIVSINNTNFISNKSLSGGAIDNQDGSLIIDNSSFINNSATVSSLGGGGIGGAITYDGGIATTISNSIFSGNSAVSGGAISTQRDLSITNSSFSNNSATDLGGAIFMGGSTLNLSNSQFSGNSATNVGGAIYSFFPSTGFLINESNFTNNSSGRGGAIFSGGFFNIRNSDFSTNSAQLTGGAISIPFSGNGITSSITNSNFSGNSAITGGGAISDGSLVLNVSDSTFTGNSTNAEGGAIRGSRTTIVNSTFSSNSAAEGGAIRSSGGETISNSTFFNNLATQFGGAIRLSNSLTIANSILTGNNAPSGQEIFANGVAIRFTGANIVGANGASGIDSGITGVAPITPTGASNTIIDTTLATNNGSTQTFALVTGSIAIDASSTAGGATPTTTDQRGFAAIGIRDLGAFEFGVAIPVPPSTPTPVPPSTPTPVPPSTPTPVPPSTPTPVPPSTPTPTTILNIDPVKETRPNGEQKIAATFLSNPIEEKSIIQTPTQIFFSEKIALAASQREQASQAISSGNIPEAIANLEFSYISELEAFTGKALIPSTRDSNVPINIPDIENTKKELARVSKITGSPTAIVYPVILSDRLVTLIVFPDGKILQRTIPNTPNESLLPLISDFRANLLDVASDDYLNESQKLHKLLIKPIETDLDKAQITTLVFIMDGALRSIPPAALHDGKKFLIEKYAVASVPSLKLARLEERDRKNSNVLAMGLTESVQGFSALPSVNAEISNIVGTGNTQPLLIGNSFFDKSFTVKNMQAQRQKQTYGIIHLATHAQFLSNKAEGAFIQFFDGRLNLKQIPSLSLDKPQVELFTLSACQTAVGNNLGLAGLAVTSGVRSVLASLWSVSDSGTVPLMLSFYSRFPTAPSKAIALQKAQLAIINGEVKIDKDKIIGIPSLPAVPLPPNSPTSIIHPYFWSSFMLVGSWL